MSWYVCRLWLPGHPRALTCAWCVCPHLLTRQWQEEFDRLNDRESELYDALVEAGYDIASFYKDHGHIDLTDDMPASERAKVDAILESVRPTKRKVGEVEEVI